MAVASCGALVAFLDVTIVSVAFPDIERRFPTTSPATLAWVLSAYNIVFAALLVPAGSLADLIGRKRLFLGGLLGFTAASACCALAPSPGALIAARVLQAASAAAIIPTSLAFVLAAFPDEERATAAGLWAAAAAVSAASGPTLAALLTHAGGWRLVFTVNLPIGLASLAVGARVLPEATIKRRRRPDLVGTMLVVAAAGLATLGIVQGNRWGWGDPWILGSLTAAALIMPLLVWRSRRHDSPVLDLDVLADRQVALGNLGTFLFAIGGFGIILNNVLFLTRVWNYSILMTGLALTPAPIAMALAAAASGKAADRYGEPVVAAPGTILFGLGTLWLTNRVGTRPDLLGRWLPGAALTGAGCGLAYPALGSAALARLPAQGYATGSAINAMFRQLGAALGFALIVSVIGTRTALGAPTAFGNGWKLAGLAGALALMPALGLCRTRPDPNETAPAAAGDASPDSRTKSTDVERVVPATGRETSALPNRAQVG